MIFRFFFLFVLATPQRHIHATLRDELRSREEEMGRFGGGVRSAQLHTAEWRCLEKKWQSWERYVRGTKSGHRNGLVHQFSKRHQNVTQRSYQNCVEMCTVCSHFYNSLDEMLFNGLLYNFHKSLKETNFEELMETAVSTATYYCNRAMFYGHDECVCNTPSFVPRILFCPNWFFFMPFKWNKMTRCRIKFKVCFLPAPISKPSDPVMPYLIL